jgi:glycosyltransferase involved in cell wall biosynthesis
MRYADADIYYVRCASFLTGILAIFCKLKKKKFVYGGAHITDFIPGQLRLPTKRDKILYKYGLRRADGIIVQSYEQKDILYDNFRLKSTVIKNFYPLNPLKLPASKRKNILWVSTIRHWKRPMQFIRLAESVPNEHFVMIGGRGEAKYTGLYHEVRKRAIKVKNLDFLGFQPFTITERAFEKCKIFINTSEYEGFPNTFLQAWSRGIPVISYVDPDHIIRKHCLGLTVRSEEDLYNALSSFLSNPTWDSAAILNYFALNHSSTVLNQYCSFFNNILQK